MIKLMCMSLLLEEVIALLGHSCLVGVSKVSWWVWYTDVTLYYYL